MTGEPFALPVVALVPRSCGYGDRDDQGQPIVVTEYEPTVLSAGGFLTTLCDAQNVPQLIGGVFAGVAPAHLDQAAALAWLETSKVMPLGPDDPGHLGVVDDPELIGRVTAARRLLPPRLSSV